MSPLSRPVPTAEMPVGSAQAIDNTGCPDRPDRPDLISYGSAENRGLSGLADRWKRQAVLDHDAAEATALADHYRARAGPELPAHTDPMVRGLFRGFHAHRSRKDTP